MNIEQLRSALLYCTIMNFALLWLWGMLYILPHEWLYRWSGRVFRFSAERFDAINFAGIVLYKVGVLLFNLIPYLALYLVK
ncbi:MAG TPA: hypothetical protein VE422_46760 [Terriglobia bacterium]|nr:hypothetical protein [Terriglobia bacterium]